MSHDDPATQPEERVQIPLPFVLSIMICDTILIDLATGKFSLHGCFDNLFAPGFPVAHPRMMLYLAMTNGRGAMRTKIQLVDTDEKNDPIFRIEGTVEFPDPLAVVDVRIAIGPVVFQVPGEYRLQVHVENKFLIERRLTVIPIGGVGS